MIDLPRAAMHAPTAMSTSNGRSLLDAIGFEQDLSDFLERRVEVPNTAA